MSQLSSMSHAFNSFNDRKPSRSLMIVKVGDPNLKLNPTPEHLGIVHQHRGKKMINNEAINFTANPITGSTQTMISGQGITRSHRYNLEPRSITEQHSRRESPKSVGSAEREEMVDFKPVNLASVGINA